VAKTTLSPESSPPALWEEISRLTRINDNFYKQLTEADSRIGWLTQDKADAHVTWQQMTNENRRMDAIVVALRREARSMGAAFADQLMQRATDRAVDEFDSRASAMAMAGSPKAAPPPLPKRRKR
jgi:hypothetical protein